MKMSYKTIIIVFVTLLIIAGLGYEAYAKYSYLTPTQKAQKGLSSVVAAVSKHMMLPKDDQPVLATITDAKMLMAQQAFFAGSTNGDQLLLFPRNLKAILWSPSRNIIVNVGSIQKSDIAATTSQPLEKNRVNPSTLSSAPVATALLVEIRNGTDKTGFASTVAKQIRANDIFLVAKVTDAEKKDYKKTVVFIHKKLDDKQKQMIKTLVATLGGEIVSNFPEGEKDTEADVLVILGSNE